MRTKILSLFFLMTVTFISHGKVTHQSLKLSLEKQSFEEFKTFHLKVIEIYSLQDKEGVGRKKTSFLSLILSEAIAGAGDRCFIGGWISQQDGSGNCLPPWNANNNANFASNFSGHLYSSEHSCRAETGRTDHMRCNPLLFGNTAASGKAICVPERPFESATQRCLDGTDPSQIESHVRNLMEDELLRDQYAILVREILNHCNESRNRNCHDLANQIARTQQSFDNQLAVAGCNLTMPQAIGLPEDLTSTMEEIVAFSTEPRPTPEGIWGPENISNSEHCNVEGMTEEAKRNCELLLSSGDIPANALKFALEGMRRNATSFQTNGCYNTAEAAGDSPGFQGMFRDGHPSMAGMRSPEEFDRKMANGIRNKCRFIINDAGDRIQDRPGRSCQMKMYVVDLCQPGGPNVRQMWSWMGYGSCENGRTPAGGEYSNENGVGTTLLGFQVTNDATFPFGSTSDAYVNLRSDALRNFERDPGNNQRVMVGGGVSTHTVPAVSLFGLQGSNSRAMADYKYLHIGAYRSAGCPSLEPTMENYRLIEELARSGPSVVVNYHEDKMEDFDQCESGEQ